MIRKLLCSMVLCVASQAGQAGVDELLLAARNNELANVEAMLRAGMDPDTSDPQEIPC